MPDSFPFATMTPAAEWWHVPLRLFGVFDGSPTTMSVTIESGDANA